MTKRVLAGIRATGTLHLGNYLGAVKGMLELQNDPNYQTLYMVADAHAVTTPYDIENLRKNRREVIVDYLASGLNPEKSVIFCQSDVAQHFELAFYFSSVTTVGKMQHLPTFKEKVKQYPENVTMALLNYPVLMAADILVYKASLVPVGIDQEPHLEVTREIARRMNQDYGTDFPEPKSFSTDGKYIPSLTGEGKMSKSVAGSFINLTDDLETIRQKIRAVPTASQVGGEMSAGLKALFAFVDLFLPAQKATYLEQYADGSLRYVDLKDALTQAVFEQLQPIQQRRAELLQDPQHIDQVIAEGSAKARAIALETVTDVRQKMGLM